MANIKRINGLPDTPGALFHDGTTSMQECKRIGRRRKRGIQKALHNMQRPGIYAGRHYNGYMDTPHNTAHHIIQVTGCIAVS